ncbi:MAG: radical SAM protein, partial [Aminobacteriaceae bacterium]
MTRNDSRTFAVMAKVVGALCNLQCEYCYYTEKTKLLAQTQRLMSDDALEAYVGENLRIHGRDAVVEFAWHGGEPLLAGIGFFRKAMDLERKYGKGRKIVNTLQTNATLLNDEWCEFFAAHDFLLGVSLDGPKTLHDV